MSPEIASVIILCGLVVLLFFGVEVGIAMGIMAAIGLKIFVHTSLGQFGLAAFDIMNSFTMTAVPLFVFMGAMLANTGSITHLFRGSEKLLSGIPASMVSAVILANSVFGAMSGSSLAATATFGKIAFPELEKLGYDKKMSLGAIVVAGSLSVLIPPSIIMVVYGGWLSVSVSRLFAAGVVPGILLSAMLIGTAVIMVKVKPSLAPKPESYSLKERLKALAQIGPFLAFILIVLGTVFLGIMTPTESAAMGAFLSIILALLYRKLTFKSIKDSMYATVTISAMIALVLVSAKMLSQVFQYLGSTESFASIVLDLNLGYYGTIAGICILYLILGCFFDSFSMLVLTLPFLIPVISNFSIDLIWFGIVYVLISEVGLITPPFGLNLFVLNSVLPKYNMIYLFAGAIPFLIPFLLIIIIMIAFPQVVTWLPSLLYG